MNLGRGESVLLGMGVLELMIKGETHAAVDFLRGLTHRELAAVAGGLALWRAEGMVDTFGTDDALSMVAEWRAEVMQNAYTEDQS